ncbi:30321_t:CDS:2, partial [Gigaspora margarita]
TKEGYESFSDRRLQSQSGNTKSFKLFRNFEQASIHSAIKYLKQPQDSAIEIVPQNSNKYKKAEKEKKMVDKKMDTYRKSEIVDIKQLDKAWNRIVNAIQKATKLYTIFKETNKLIRMLKKKKDLSLKVLNEIIDKINKLAEVYIDKLEQIDIQDAQKESTELIDQGVTNEKGRKILSDIMNEIDKRRDQKAEFWVKISGSSKEKTRDIQLT